MVLNLSRSFSRPEEDGGVGHSVYNIDLSELFNAFAGIEDQSRSLGALELQPSTDGTIFKIRNAAGTVTLSYSTSTGELYIGGDIDDL